MNTVTKEWVNGREVLHDHLFKEYPNTEPNGVVGTDGWLVHDHQGEERHAHQQIAQWEDETPVQEYTWYGPARELPDAVSSWNLM